jgi:metallo-beta-lactamase class B
LSSILITSGEGHVLINGGLPESATQIAANIRQLGFRLEDVKLILNSHAHFDHAGGIAELQRLSGAEFAASEPSAMVFKEGASGPDDPQYGTLPPVPAVEHVRIVTDGEAMRVGPLELTAHRTAGHTRGGTSWTWTSCEGERCVSIVYADSINPASATGFRFTDSPHYPDAVKDFEKSFATLSELPCDVLLTAHPEMSNTWVKLQKRDTGADANAFVTTDECHGYVEGARERLGRRVADERR